MTHVATFDSLYPSSGCNELFFTYAYFCPLIIKRFKSFLHQQVINI